MPAKLSISGLSKRLNRDCTAQNCRGIGDKAALATDLVQAGRKFAGDVALLEQSES